MDPFKTVIIIHRAYRNLACCLSQLQSDCPDPQVDISGMLGGLNIMLQGVTNATTESTICGLPDTDVVGTACSQGGTCTYAASKYMDLFPVKILPKFKSFRFF